MWSCTQITSLICFPQGEECKNNIRESPWPGVCTHGRRQCFEHPLLDPGLVLWSEHLGSVLCSLLSCLLSLIFAPLCLFLSTPLCLSHFSYLLCLLANKSPGDVWCAPSPQWPFLILLNLILLLLLNVLCGAPPGQHSLWWTVLGAIMSADTHVGREKTKRRLSSEASLFPELTHHCIWESGHWLFSSSNSKHLRLSLCSNRGSVTVS